MQTEHRKSEIGRKSSRNARFSGRYEQAEESLARQSDALLSCEDSVIERLLLTVTDVTSYVSDSAFLNARSSPETAVNK